MNTRRRKTLDQLQLESTRHPYPLSPQPPRPSHEEVAAVLRAIISGAPWLADLEPVDLVGPWGRQRVDAVAAGGVWRLWMWWERRPIPNAPHPQLTALDRAVCPDGREWRLGCGRWPTWDAGPDAEVLNPVRHLLEEHERWRLEERLSLEVVLLPVK